MTTLPLVDPTAEVLPAEAIRKEADLLARLSGLEGAVVAFSGGVDSTYVAWAAQKSLGDRAVAITGVSASVSASQLGEARALAQLVGVRHEEIATDELADPRYLANAPDRCYWCKSELYDRLRAIAAERGIPTILDGTNHDDLGDLRPGRRAAEEHGVRSPLVEVGLGKSEIRWLSRRAGLPSWHRPASPCLSSRVPHGEAIDPGKLARIAAAERAVAALGFREFRVRHIASRARIEVAAEELERAMRPDLRARLEAAAIEAGFDAAMVDEVPFQSGRLARAGKAQHDNE